MTRHTGEDDSHGREDDQSNRVILSKKDAAAFLGVTPRAVNRYVAAGRLKVIHQPSPTGGSDLAFFDPADLEAFKNAPREPVGRDRQALVKPVKADLETLLQALLAPQSRTTKPRASDFDSQLTLSLKEAAIVARQSVESLRQAIKDGKLKAAIRGRGWNVKRSDLEEWVRKL